MSPDRSSTDFERALATRPAAPRDAGSVRLICVRLGEHAHDTPSVVALSPDGGVVGDRWAMYAAEKDPRGEAAVTLINSAVAEVVTAGRHGLDAPGDNLVVELDIGVDTLPAGSRLGVGSAVLEVSAKPHTGCKTFRDKFGVEALAWVSTPAGRGRRLRGMNCSVVKAGTVHVGDRIEVLQRGVSAVRGQGLRRELVARGPAAVRVAGPPQESVSDTQ